MCSRKRLTFIKDFINNESICHFMVVQLYLICSNGDATYIICEIIAKNNLNLVL